MGLYEILKASKLGAGAAPDMYTALFAQKIKGGEAELSGVPPLTFRSSGTPLIGCLISGNTIPGTGDRTGNLLDKNAADRTTTGYIKSDGSIQSSTNFSTSGYIPISEFDTITLSGYNGGNEPAYCLYDSNKEYISGSAYTGRATITLAVGTAAFIRMSYRNTAADTAMCNEGSTPLPHEPYGYKIPIICGGTITTVYIGSNPLRKSLDGTAVDEISSNGTLTQRVDTDGSVLPTPIVSQIDTPEIPTNNGSNTFDVDTTVKPSEVYIKYRT